VLDRVSRSARGISHRLIASYVLVTVVAVVLAEVFVLGYLAPRWLSEAQLHAEVEATAARYWSQLRQHDGGGVPMGTVLGDHGTHVRPGVARTAADGTTLVVPAVSGRLAGRRPVTAVVAIARDGTVIASSAPSRYPTGALADAALPPQAWRAIEAHLGKGVSGGTGTTPYGTVSWTLYATAAATQLKREGATSFLYVQAPQTSGFVNPLQAWDELGLRSGNDLVSALYPLLLAVIPVGVLLGLLGSRRLVRRVRQLEQATVAVAEGDYTVSLRASGRDEVGRLEANFATMTHQLSSAMAAERERVALEARAAERSRIAREIHDAISQHLFGLRMIASGMRRADPDNDQVQIIERITEEALQEMQALLRELRPPGLDGAGLAPALQQMCAAYRDRLGVTVDSDVADLPLPGPVEDALLRVTQEACTNALRHGDARRLSVSMNRWDGHVQLAVRDDGTGFDPVTSHPGSGLRHIRDRVSELGGTVDIQSAPGEGAAVTVRVPVP
jgi:signal transduction histidine kinase